VKNKKFSDRGEGRDVEIHAEKKIVLHCEDLEVKTKKTGKIDIGTTFDPEREGQASVKAGPQLNLKAFSRQHN